MNVKYNLRKIPATDKEYIKARDLNQSFLNDFEEYLERKTIEANVALEGKSGKAGSYARYLIKLYVIVNEQIKVDMDSFEFHQELSLIKSDINYDKYNKTENYFPNSTIREFQEYWLQQTLKSDYYDDTMK